MGAAEQDAFSIDLSGRVAVVTGGTSGIGRATAALLARCGAKVFVGDLELRRDATQEFEPLGVHQQVCDVCDLPSLQHLIDYAAESGGRLDFLINNAGVVQVGQVSEIEEETWDRVLDTNLKAVFFGIKFALPHLLRSGGGSIVNTASNAGLLPRAHDPVYSISKMAVVGLTRSLALSHSKDRIRINCVCPGPVEETAIMSSDLASRENPEDAARQYVDASPLARAWGRMITPREVAESVVYLCSDAAAMVTGTAIAIDGGKSLGVPPRP